MCIRDRHDTLNVVKQTPDQDFDLLDYFSLDCMLPRVANQTKEGVFQLATERLAGRYDDDISPIIIKTALWEREQMQNTAVGSGVAMPHATISRVATGDSSIAIVTSEQEFDYGTPDGSKVDICFFTMGPPADRQIHLKILTYLGRMALDAGFLKRLRAATTAEEILEVARDFVASSGQRESGA